MPKISGLVTAREKEVARRVQQAREHINWPQPAFAAELDISRDRLASVEYARTPLRFSDGYRICMVFDINPEWLANGTGDMRSNLLTPDLPLPEGFPARAMFTTVYDDFKAGKLASTPRKFSRIEQQRMQDDLVPNFDATAHVVRNLSELLAKEKFHSPLIRQEFALEITTYARELALRLKRDAARDRARPVQGRKGVSSKDVAGLSARNVKLVGKLREGIRKLEKEIARLEGTMKGVNPLAVSASSLPKPAAFEVRLLEEAIEKIARQIEEAEAKMKALTSKRNKA
jgi:transcriptional regulator with XRE-family HTH domain